MINQLTAENFDASWEIEHLAHAFPWSKAQLLYQLNIQDSNYGLWQDDQLCAIAMVQRIFPEAELLNIAVHPSQQGKKLAKQLLQYVLEQLKQQQYERLYLEVRMGNQRAINLYESLGFNQIGERLDYYPAKNGREDALLYGIELCL